MSIDVIEIFKDHQKVVQKLENYLPDIQQVAEKMITAIRQNGTIFWMGNGGSAADAQHMAAELVGRFQKERKALSSYALTTDSSILTSVGNDYGFNTIFSRQIEGLCKPQDVIMALSTSGNSENVIQGVMAANKIGAYTVALTGESGGKLKSMASFCLTVPSNITARIQEGHSLIGHILCEIIDAAF
jgi:D-sedoheptulose 7-phosphate isomerase